MPSEVSSDTSVNVKTATDMVGKLEGISNLGTTWISSGRFDGYFMAGLAYDAHTKDIRSDLTGTQTVNTYWLDVLENQTYVNSNVYYLATKYGGFTVPTGFSPYATTNGTSTLTASMWHTNTDTVGSNSRPDNYYTANNPEVMKAGLTAAFEKISSELSEATSTAYVTATANESVSGAAFAASYNPKTWSGELTASTVTYNADGTLAATAAWTAAALLDARTSSNRTIVTCCTTTGAGLPFTSTALSTSTLGSRTNYASFAAVPGVPAAAQNAALFTDYLRGARTYESAVAATTAVPNPPVYRARSHVLGDIVNSKVLVVGPPNEPYYDATNVGYSTFVRNRASRATVVFAGANDGMLHAFNGALTGTTAGRELFAYVPSFVYGDTSTAATTGLASLGNPSFTHHFFVDSTPTASDVDFNLTNKQTGLAADWRTLLVGGLGKGGKGYFAIDVSDPSTWTSETNVASKVLWEFTDSRMGYSYGDARMVKTKKYGWVVLLASGYNNADGKGYLFVVDPKTGALLETMATADGTVDAPLNLGQLTAYVPENTDYTAESVYAGDLQGNVWRFDLTATGNTAYPAPLKLARLVSGGTTGQPITAPVRVAIDPVTNKRYVFVGTGRLLADSDITSTQRQSFYAIVDGTKTAFFTAATLPTGASFPILRAQLNANTSLLTGIGSTPTSAMGWYVDLGTDSASGVAERITIQPTYVNGVVAAAISLPNGEACNPSGTSRLIAVSMSTGQTVLTNASGNLIATSATMSGVVTDLAFKNINGKLKLISGTSQGSFNPNSGNFSAAQTLKRVNWREVLTAD